MPIYRGQIESRIKQDRQAFEEGFLNLASVVMGQGHDPERFLSERETTKSAIEDILKHYNIVPEDLPEDITTLEEQLEYMLRPHGIMRRRVKLEGDWFKNGIGPLLGRTSSNRIIALIPGKKAGYTYFDHKEGKHIKVTGRNAGSIDRDSYCFYKPLPLTQIGVKSLLKFMARSLSPSDYGMAVFCGMVSVMLSLIIPFANMQIFSHVIPYGGNMQLFAISSLLLGATVSSLFIRMTRNIVDDRIKTKIETAIESASMSRLLSLPTSFFKEYNSGEITQRMQSISALCRVLTQTVLGVGITTVFSLFYIGQIALMTPVLALPAFMIITACLTLTLVNASLSSKSSKKEMESTAKLKGITFAIISGIQKIKLSGSEKRAFAKWAKAYSENAAFTFNPPLYKKIGPVLVSAVSLIGNVALIGIAAASDITVAEFMAFSVSFGFASGAVMSLAKVTASISYIWPILEMSKPILATAPEISKNKRVLTRTPGNVELNSVSFRYDEDMPLVIDNLSLRISRGQHVAIVGASGCGKSTLLRLLLGFESPHKGAIYYDGNDMRSIDLKSLRGFIGCVLQDGRLFPGTVYENITISAPGLSLKEAWEAAEIAGIADDIKSMPMQMNTIISEGNGGISGGQRQRFLIARAIAPKPGILLMDEATSALDNITQRNISEALGRLKCTRIVIAHRLSTIRDCDRIVLLDKGQIAEEGTFNKLIKYGNIFAKLVERQCLI